MVVGLCLVFCFGWVGGALFCCVFGVLVQWFVGGFACFNGVFVGFGLWWLLGGDFSGFLGLVAWVFVAWVGLIWSLGFRGRWLWCVDMVLVVCVFWGWFAGFDDALWFVCFCTSAGTWVLGGWVFGFSGRFGVRDLVWNSFTWVRVVCRWVSVGGCLGVSLLGLAFSWARSFRVGLV